VHGCGEMNVQRLAIPRRDSPGYVGSRLKLTDLLPPWPKRSLRMRSALAMLSFWPNCNPSSSRGDRDRRATRESQAGLSGAAERLVASMKPGNASGEKEPCI
jgi:hypothetical protein